MHAICTFVFTLFLPLRHCSWLMETIFKKVRTENILKIYKHLVLPTFLYGSENWTLTALQRRGIEAAEVKLLRPLTGYTLHDHKTNDYIRCKLRITGIIDKIDEYRRNWLSHLQRMPQIESLWNHTTTDHKDQVPGHHPQGVHLNKGTQVLHTIPSITHPAVYKSTVSGYVVWSKLYLAMWSNIAWYNMFRMLYWDEIPLDDINWGRGLYTYCRYPYMNQKDALISINLFQ